MAHTMGFSKVKLEVKKFAPLSSTAKYIFIVFQCVGQFALALANWNTWYIERNRKYKNKTNKNKSENIL